MKKTFGTILLFASLIFISALIFKAYAAKEKSAEMPNLKPLEVKAWDDTIYKLVPPPTEDGNAMTYIVQAIHYNPATEGDGKSKMGYPWWVKVDNINWESEKPENKAIAAEAIKIPELDTIVKASLQKNYQLYGVYLMPSPKPNETAFENKILRYIDIARLSYLLSARADDKLSKGDKTGAEADMLAAVRIGHIIEKDVTVLGLMLGDAVENKLATKMGVFYRKLGKEEKAKAWEALLPTIQNRIDSSKGFVRYTDYASFGELKKIVENPNMPRSLRTESLIFMVANKFKTRSGALTSVPKEIKNYITSEHFDDPEMVVVQMKLIEDVYVGRLSTLKGRMAITGLMSPL